MCSSDLRHTLYLTGLVRTVADSNDTGNFVRSRSRTCFTCCTGSSSRNIEAIASDIKKSLTNIRNVEGLDECNWVLIDAGDIIVSVFSKDAREYYQLDAFYSRVDGSQSEEEQTD